MTCILFSSPKHRSILSVALNIAKTSVSTRQRLAEGSRDEQRRARQLNQRRVTFLGNRWNHCSICVQHDDSFCVYRWSLWLGDRISHVHWRSCNLIEPSIYMPRNNAFFGCFEHTNLVLCIFYTPRLLSHGNACRG